jgi:hypothetical protein
VGGSLTPATPIEVPDASRRTEPTANFNFWAPDGPAMIAEYRQWAQRRDPIDTTCNQRAAYTKPSLRASIRDRPTASTPTSIDWWTTP